MKKLIGFLMIMILVPQLCFGAELRYPYQCPRGVTAKDGALVCDDNSEWGGDATFPAGSYAGSCVECRVESNVLSCRCFDGDNNLLARSTLRSPYECSRGVVNASGQLQCERNTDWGGNGHFPGGTYSFFCHNCRLDSHLIVLKCDC